jgi:uncharacterized spore protein YtfJ
MPSKKKLQKFGKTSMKVTGKPIKLNNRILLPIVERTNFTNNQADDAPPGKPIFLGLLINPLAFVLIEDEGEWLLPVQDEKLTLCQLKEEIPNLAAEILEARTSK